MNKLSEEFLNELFRLCFLKKDILDIVKEHLKYSDFAEELQIYRHILKSLKATPEDKLPSIGVVSQQYASNIDVQEALTAIKEARIADKDQLLLELETYIKNQRFKVLNKRTVELYQSDRQDEAIELTAKESVQIVNFTLRASKNQFLRVFSDFTTQTKDKQLKHERGEDVSEKVPFGIDILDDKTFGGIDTGDIALWIMRSGVGKSTVLKWTGMYACRLGYDVLHIQLEGSKQEAFDKYSQIWTKLDYKDLKFGDISKEKMDQLKNVVSEMNKVGKELYVYSFEKFGEASIVDVRDIIIEYQKMKGKFPDLIIIDSLDLLRTGENTKIDGDPNWKKDKMQKVAQRMKDIATEFKTRVLTATQSSDVPFSKWNDIDFVMDRSFTEADRTLVKPFSFVFTFNVTMDENKNNVGRVYIDKFRNYKINDPICRIATKYDKGAFYDRKRTMEIMERAKKL